VSELRQWIRNQAAKTGVAIVEHQGVSTWTCSNSGQRFVPVDPAKLVQTCPCCSRAFDQDVEACRNMLAAYGARGAVAAE
jgi:transposase